MIIGYIFGIPISIWAVYFIVVRPLLSLARRADPKSKIGQGLEVVAWVLLGLLISITAIVVMGVVFFFMAVNGQI